jgi:DNA ligase-1
MRLVELVETSREVTATRSRGRKIELLSAALRRVEGEELETAVAFLAGSLRQARVGIGGAAVRALADEASATEPTLTLLDVDEAFAALAATAGRGATALRQRALRALFARATREEQRFLARLVLGELRQGALEGVLAEAVAQATEVTLSEVQRAAMLTGELPLVARVARERGTAGLAAIRLEVGRPLQPMLAQTADSSADAIERLGLSSAAEWKLDGARVQVHRAGSDVQIFTRAGNDVTPALPELVDAVRGFGGGALVLDGEALSIRPDGRPQPFQVTMRRFGRRLDVEDLRKEIPLSGFYFDVLHADGEDLIDRPFSERRRILEERLPAEFCVPHRRVEDAAALDAFLAEALTAGHEGVMVKAFGAAYEAGRRGAGWLKLKPTRTLDLVVLAAEWGSGRRQGWLSNLHLGARDPRSGGFVMLGKTFKGLTDELLVWQTQRLQELEISRDAYTVFVRPEQVVEVAFDGVQQSPHYPGGVALRFARVRRYRSDKLATEADTIDDVRSMQGS